MSHVPSILSAHCLPHSSATPLPSGLSCGVSGAAAHPRLLPDVDRLAQSARVADDGGGGDALRVVHKEALRASAAILGAVRVSGCSRSMSRSELYNPDLLYSR